MLVAIQEKTLNPPHFTPVATFADGTRLNVRAARDVRKQRSQHRCEAVGVITNVHGAGANNSHVVAQQRALARGEQSAGDNEGTRRLRLRDNSTATSSTMSISIITAAAAAALKDAERKQRSAAVLERRRRRR